MTAWRTWHGVLSIVLLLAIAIRTHAQGTNQQLPDPISAARLSAYADLLNLSPQQRHALDDLHATYRAEFQTLRQGEITQWLNTAYADMLARAYPAKQRELLGRIAAIDERFFDSAIPILTDEQAARLPRVRALRQRERAMQVGAVWLWNDAPPFDLSQALEDLTLTADEHQAIDPTLDSYESALTTRFQAAIDDYFTTFKKSFDAYEQAGWTADRRADPANFEASNAVVKPIWQEWAGKRHAQMNGMVDLNRRTLASIRPLLAPAAGRELWKRFVERTYSSTHFLYLMPLLVRTSSPYAKALARENLTEEQRATLQAQSDEFDADLDATIGGLIEKIEQYRATYVAEYDSKDEFDARNAVDLVVKDAWDRLDKREAGDRSRIAALIGPEPAAAPVILDPATVDFVKVGYHTIVFGRPEVSGRLPPAISAADLADFARWLALDDSQAARVHEAYDRYLGQFAEFKDKYRPIVLEISGALDAGDTVQGWTKENLQRLRDTTARALDAQRAVETAFLGEVESIVGRKPDDAGMQRVRLARERQWCNCAVYSSETRQAGGRTDGMFDLERMLRRVSGLDLSSPTVDQILLKYEQAIAPLLNSRQDAMLAYSREDNDLRVQWQELRAKTGNPGVDTTALYAQSNIKALKDAARQAADPIAELNRTTVEQLEKALPAEAAQRVRRTFERLSWPQIYSDRFSTAPLLAAAQKLGDLAAPQRREVENIAADYYSAYDVICEKMKTMVEGPDSAIYDQEHSTDEQRLAFRHRWEERDKVIFERYELNMKVWQRLKGVLTDEQAKAIGMGAKPPDPPTNYDQFGT